MPQNNEELKNVITGEFARNFLIEVKKVMELKGKDYAMCLINK